MKFLLLTMLIFPPILKADFHVLAENLFLDHNSHKTVLEKDCSNTPGRVCIWHCYTVINYNTNSKYLCNFEATGYFKEKIVTPNGDLFTGNKLEATDFRSIVIYPYQDAEICFNFGKETYPFPSYPQQYWIYTKSRIIAECNGSRTSREFPFYIYF